MAGIGEKKVFDAFIDLKLIRNDVHKYYQVQVQGTAVIPYMKIPGLIREASEAGHREGLPLDMGAVIDVNYVKWMFDEILRLEGLGYRAVGRGSEYLPETVLDERWKELEGWR